MGRGGEESQATRALATAGRMMRNGDRLAAKLALVEMGLEDDRDDWGVSEEWVMEAIEQNWRTLAAHTQWEDVWLTQAMLLRVVGREAESFQTLRTAALSGGNSSDVWLQLALMLYERLGLPQVTTALANALVLDMRSAQLHYRLALSFCGQLEFDLTMEKLRQEVAEDAQRRVWTALERMWIEPAGMDTDRERELQRV